jgi:hypothetical protein
MRSKRSISHSAATFIDGGSRKKKGARCCLTLNSHQFPPALCFALRSVFIRNPMIAKFLEVYDCENSYKEWLQWWIKLVFEV